MNYRPCNRIVEVADPSGAVVPIADLRDQVRAQGFEDDDASLVAKEKAAVTMIEQNTQRLLISREVVLRLPGLPDLRTPVELFGGSVSAVESVVADGEAVTGAVAYGKSPAVLVPSADWPNVTGEGYPVVITYTAGYSTVPSDLIEAIKLLVGHFYANREGVVLGVSAVSLPLGIEALIAPYRIRSV